MSGYANRFITVPFPDLAEEGDEVYVVIRNPKLIPPGDLRRKELAVGPDGEPLNMDEAIGAGYDVIAKIIVNWHVYDAQSVEAEQPLLGLPATGELVAKLPLEILNALGQELQKVNPQKPTASPTDGTST